MEGVDKEKVQRIVYEMSKGSKYFQNEEKKEAYMKQKVDSMQAQFAKLTDLDISHYQKIADKKIVELEATRDLSRIWLHVDMDAFYAAVETLCNLSLKGEPMAIGGMSMISTTNYEVGKAGLFVETLDKCFSNVCELDIVFNFNKVHTILDEIILGGQVLETSSSEVVKAVDEISRLEKHASSIWQGR